MRITFVMGSVVMSVIAACGRASATPAEMVEMRKWVEAKFETAAPSESSGMVQVFRREVSIYRSADLVLRGLDRAARYTITDLDAPEKPREMTGGDLLEKGLPVEIGSRPGSALFTYKRTGHGIIR